MIDFGLEPCPMCGGEAEVAMLSQGPEELKAVIRCTACGLTLNWETEIKVGVSRSGKRTVAKAGPDPIEAWNRRTGGNGCEKCGSKFHSDAVSCLPNCNDCGSSRDCEYMPEPGQMARINCPLWRPQEAQA